MSKTCRLRDVGNGKVNLLLGLPGRCRWLDWKWQGQKGTVVRGEGGATTLWPHPSANRIQAVRPRPLGRFHLLMPTSSLHTPSTTFHATHYTTRNFRSLRYLSSFTYMSSEGSHYGEHKYVRTSFFHFHVINREKVLIYSSVKKKRPTLVALFKDLIDFHFYYALYNLLAYIWLKICHTKNNMIYRFSRNLKKKIKCTFMG